ncbi:MAG: peptidoglycan DD-metalloendopeptidase family protein [Firmicutes bacterium]|nr:peptidoglycan DD-metalloendopeptidase family protein [Bacillota bacterium]MBQ4371812.1 peptidoglycan DD-metalloendopeptidase family protein [Bacillota bacterium]
MKQKLFKRIICLLMALCVCAAAVPSRAFASQLDKAQSNLDQKNQEIKNQQSQVNETKNQSSALQAEINSMERQIYSKNVELNRLNKEINKTKEEITEVLAQIEVKEAEIAEQNSALGARLRAMYKNGSGGLLTVLFGSSSMSSFMTNMDMVQRIYSADADMLAGMQAQYDELEGSRKRLQALKETLLTQQANAEAKRVQLETDIVGLSEKKREVDKSLAEQQDQLKQLKAEADALTATIRKLQGDQSYAGGTMLWPSAASRYISSPFGNRVLFGVKEFHTGIDIAAAAGTNILAANSGTVIKAGYNNSYGYMIMIDHGGGIVTLYAHSSKLLVSTGDVVARGQVIALIGSTGRSTGPHLHFEVRVNGAYQNPLNYVSR